MAGRAGAAGVEPLFFYIGPEWYKGREPRFYEPSLAPATKVLEENFSALKAEIDDRFDRHPEYFRVNYTPHRWREAGWRTINLYSYFLRDARSCARFPRTDEIVRSIPGMCLAQIAVLAPQTRLKAHFGDTNALIRHHLGIRVPGAFPDLGMRVGRETRCWEEGEVFAIQIAHRHYAWNYTDQPRISLVVDVVRPEYAERRYEVAGKALSAMAMKHVVTRHPVTRRLPRPVVRAVHRTLGLGIRARLAAQRHLGI